MVDKLNPHGSDDLTGIFQNMHLWLRATEAKAVFGLQDCHILPVANYVKETTQNITQDVMALLAMNNIIGEAVSHLENKL